MSGLRAQRVDFLSTWTTLEEELFSVFVDPFSESSQSIASEWERLHRMVYDLCVGRCHGVPDDIPIPWRVPRAWVPQPGALYYLFRRSLVALVRGFYVETITRSSSETMLASYSEVWKRFEAGMQVAQRVFLYMSREFIDRLQTMRSGYAPLDVLPIQELAMNTWRENVSELLHEHLLPKFLLLLERDRRDDLVDRSVASTMRDSIVSMGLGMSYPMQLYEEWFEPSILSSTRQFYTDEAVKILSQVSLREYMRLMENCLSGEQDRIISYVHPSSRPKVLETCLDVLVRDKQDLLVTECNLYFDEESYCDLRRVYRLLTHTTKGIEVFGNIFSERVKNEGLELYSNLSEREKIDPLVFGAAVVGLCEKIFSVIHTVFNSDPHLLASVSNGFDLLINYEPFDHQLSAELLSKYASTLLKPNSKLARTLGSDRVQHTLQLVIDISCSLHDRDVFLSIYHDQLARRLIQSSYSSVLELEALEYLQCAHDWENTAKMKKMLVDVDVSRELERDFHIHSSSVTGDLEECSILVCTAAYWPVESITSSENMYLPCLYLNCIRAFSDYYRGLHSGRILRWSHELSTVSVRMIFKHLGAHTYELTCTIFQYSMLELLSCSPGLTLGSLLLQTNYPKTNLLRHLDSLLKSNLVGFENMNGEPMYSSQLSVKGLSLETKLFFNFSFSSPHKKVVTHLPTLRESREHAEKRNVNVQEDRKFAIQAAVVRVMKSRKVLRHVDVVGLVLQTISLRFRPQLEEIEDAIASLCNKDYLEEIPSPPHASSSSSTSALSPGTAPPTDSVLDSCSSGSQPLVHVPVTDSSDDSVDRWYRYRS